MCKEGKIVWSCGEIANQKNKFVLLLPNITLLILMQLIKNIFSIIFIVKYLQLRSSSSVSYNDS